MKSIKVQMYISLALAILVLLDIGAYISLAITNVLKENVLIMTLFAILTPVLVAAAITVASISLYNRSYFKSMINENRYNFGKERRFYNYGYFERIIKTKKLFKKGSQFVLAFTATDYNTMRNTARNDAITIFSNEIATAITQIIRNPDNRYKPKNFCYCYYHGVFIIYIWGDESTVRQLILEIEKSLYEIPEKHNLRVFVQPFFGIYQINDPKEDLFICCDNALMARNQSERYFENITFYSPAIRKSSSFEEVEEISQAIKDGEFIVYYQPKYHLATHRFTSSEALIRWNSTKYGFLDPSKFIQKAEYGGLIHELDMFVFRKVCEDLSETKRKGRRTIPVSINFSLYEFYSPSFLDDLINILEEYKIPPSLVEIEITETTSQSNPFVSISIMKKLRDRGLKILMDDFGVGFSNFKNLKNMPIDTIKIDKSFIDEIVTDSKSREIVKFLISLCKVNGMEVIAEGVDNKEQVEILRKAKCDTIQGFFYSKPLSKNDYDKFLSSNEFEKKGAN